MHWRWQYAEFSYRGSGNAPVWKLDAARGAEAISGGRNVRLHRINPSFSAPKTGYISSVPWWTTHRCVDVTTWTEMSIASPLKQLIEGEWLQSPLAESRP